MDKRDLENLPIVDPATEGATYIFIGAVCGLAVMYIVLITSKAVFGFSF